jgi:hypothetical protein
MFHLRLQLAEHIRQYSVSSASPSGWDVQLEEDSELRVNQRYEDWHRVERAIAAFQRDVQLLTERGWTIVEA